MDQALEKKLLIEASEKAILKKLENGLCGGQELEKYTFKHIVTIKAIHILAFIIAYKNLEAKGQIKINRSYGVPFPMTDWTTTFTLATTNQER